MYIDDGKWPAMVRWENARADRSPLSTKVVDKIDRQRSEK